MIQDFQSRLTINKIKRYLPEMMLEYAINQQLPLITLGQTKFDAMHKIPLTNRLELTDIPKQTNQISNSSKSIDTS